MPKALTVQIVCQQRFKYLFEVGLLSLLPVWNLKIAQTVNN